jgi:Tol biopolymer transport system component
MTPGVAAAAMQGASSSDPCTIKELKKSNPQGLKVYAPDEHRYVINKEDDKKIAQMYVGQNGSPTLTCITCEQRPGGPRPQRLKMQPHWHPSGKWIIMAAEREKYSKPPIIGWSRTFVEGQLQTGLWTDMWAVTPDGKKWVRLTDFKSGVKGTADGYTGPAFSPDGKKAVWSQIVDGNVFQYWPFGRWELILADVTEKNGMIAFKNKQDITPAGMHWNEPGNFAPDNETMMLTGSTEKDAQGMDQYILNVKNKKLTNLTNSPKVWDEHGLFSPDGQKIIWMSAHPYREDENASKVTKIRTEFMLMNRDGSDWRQLTHFREPGYPEYPSGIAANPEWAPDGRTVNLLALLHPKFEYWDLTFTGPCGKKP